jgi:hypothetical protein
MSDGAKPENPATSADAEQKKILDLLRGGFDTETTLSLRVLREKAESAEAGLEAGDGD